MWESAGRWQLCLVAGAVLYGLMLNVALALVPAATWRTSAWCSALTRRAASGAASAPPAGRPAALAKELDKLAPLLAERSGVCCEQQPRTGSGRVYLFIRLPRQADRQP